MRKLIRLAIVMSTAAGLLATGVTVVPRAWDAVRVVWFHDDPVLRAEHELKSVAGDAYEREIRAALAEDDPDLAAGMVALAAEKDVTLPPDLVSEVESAAHYGVGRALGDLWDGAAKGEINSRLGLAAALGTELTFIADIRDLTREGLSYPDYDPVIVSLAAAGLGLTAATYVTFGASLPAKVGVSALKTAARAGRLSARLVGELTTIARRTINGDALALVGRMARKGDLRGARRAAGTVLHGDGAARIVHTGRTLGRIGSRQGARAVQATLKRADSTGDIARLARLSERYDGTYRAVLRLVPKAGKGLAKFGWRLAVIVTWILSGLVWLVSTLVWLLFAIRDMARLPGMVFRVASGLAATRVRP